MKWSNGLGSRARKAWLILIKGEEIFAFDGQSLPNSVAVLGTEYTKNGKWSETTYSLALFPGVRAIPGRDGWETGTFAEGLASATDKPTQTWADVGEALGVSVPAAMRWLKEWRPRAAEKLDEVEARLAALDEAAEAANAATTVDVTVSFGAPTRRQQEEGFWTMPKFISGYDGGSIELIDPTGGWTVGNVRIVGAIGTVLSATASSGYRGGYVSVVVRLAT